MSVSANRVMKFAVVGCAGSKGGGKVDASPGLMKLTDTIHASGASEGRIFRAIVLPTLKPILATLATFSFLGSWSDFLWPLIILNDSQKQTLPVALANLSREHVQDVELMMAGSVVTLVPVLLLFLVLQRYYIAGLMAGSVKG